MADSQWSYKTARELARALEAKKVSALELAQDAIARIERHDAKINAVCVRDFERALEAARTADAALAKGDVRPLTGIPMTVKESYNVAGLPTTAACPAYAYTPRQDATAVADLRAARALVLGKTNLDQFATGLNGTRSPYGPCRNSFDPEYIAGGSSSGSAVATALGLASFALGTDTAGPGRVAAALNNILGL